MPKIESMVKPTETLFIQNNPNKPFIVSDIPNLNQIELMWVRNEIERQCAVCSQQTDNYKKEASRRVSNFFSDEQKKEVIKQKEYWSDLHDYWKKANDAINNYLSYLELKTDKAREVFKLANQEQLRIIQLFLLREDTAKDTVLLENYKTAINYYDDAAHFNQIIECLNHPCVRINPALATQLLDIYKERKYKDLSKTFWNFILDFKSFREEYQKDPRNELISNPLLRPFFDINHLLFEDQFLLCDEGLRNIFLTMVEKQLEEYSTNGNFDKHQEKLLSTSINRNFFYLIKNNKVAEDKYLLFLLIHINLKSPFVLEMILDYIIEHSELIETLKEMLLLNKENNEHKIIINALALLIKIASLKLNEDTMIQIRSALHCNDYLTIKGIIADKKGNVNKLGVYPGTESK